jgi:hypothetical protein
MTLSAATTSLSTSTPSTGVGTGALQVAGGIYAGAASYFGGNVTVAGTGVSTIGASGARVLVNGATDDTSTSFQVSGNSSLGSISLQAGPTTYANYKMTFTAQAADEAYIVNFGGYKMLTGEGFNTPEVTKLYSNNTLALTLSSTQAATFAGAVTGLRFIASTSLIAGDFTSTNDVAIVAKSTTAVYNPEIAAFLAPSQLTYGVGGYSNVYCGVAQSAYNSGSLMFSYAGAGSTSNSFGLGIYGQSPALRINGTGVVTIPSTIAGSAGAGALVVSGGIGVAGASYFGGAVSVTRSVNTLAGSFVATNSNGGTGAGCVFSASNGTSSGWFGISSIGYTTYGILTADSVGIYTDKSIFIASDNPSGRVKIGVGSSIPAVGDFSATGLAVTGTLSSTGAATFGGAVTTSSTTLSGAGAIPITTSLVKFTSTGGAQALTLANGSDGQRLTIVHDVDGGSGVLTPTTKTGFSTVTFTNAGDTVSLVYVTTRGWMVTGSYLATIAP